MLTHLTPLGRLLKAAKDIVLSNETQSALSHRPFHSSSSLSESRARMIARRKKAKVLAQRNEALQTTLAKKADPVLGSILPRAGSSPVQSNPQDLWNGCRLQKILLRPQDLWYSPPPVYSRGETPSHFLPGLSEADQQLLFNSLPHVVSAVRFDPDRESQNSIVDKMQSKQTELLMRSLDLRNASKKGIEIVNRKRIIEEFGEPTAGTGQDTGSSSVQVALLTHQIRSIYEHLSTNPRDIQNKRALRLLVHKRASIFKYIRRRDYTKYIQLLSDLGLAPSAVEGEIIL